MCTPTHTWFRTALAAQWQNPYLPQLVQNQCGIKLLGCVALHGPRPQLERKSTCIVHWKARVRQSKQTKSRPSRLYAPVLLAYRSGFQRLTPIAGATSAIRICMGLWEYIISPLPSNSSIIFRNSLNEWMHFDDKTALFMPCSGPPCNKKR